MDLEKYQNSENIPQFLLDDGGIVIGTEVDENNQLHYVIDREGSLSIEKASGMIPVENLKSPRERKLIKIENLPES